MKNETPKRFVFVGERPSRTAARRGWTWRDGRLAAKTLHEALSRNGIDPAQQEYVNLFGDDCERDAGGGVIAERIRLIRRLLGRGYTAVGMGKRVCRHLSGAGVSHVALRHPAARGRLRRSELYVAHVRRALTETEATEKKRRANKASTPTDSRQVQP
jgi:hypothetical protein